LVAKERCAIHIIDTPGTYDVEDAASTVEDHGQPQYVMSMEEGTVEANPQMEVQSVLDEQSGSLHAGIIVVFDVNRRASYEEAVVLLATAHENLVKSSCSCEAHIPLIFVANKIDRPKRKRTTSRKEAQALAAQFGAAYVESSARLSRRTEEVFLVAAKRVFTTSRCADYKPLGSRVSILVSTVKRWFGKDEDGNEEEGGREDEDEEEGEEKPDRCYLVSNEGGAEESEDDENEDGAPPWPPQPLSDNPKGTKRMYKQWAIRKRDYAYDEELQRRRSEAHHTVMASRQATCHDPIPAYKHPVPIHSDKEETTKEELIPDEAEEDEAGSAASSPGDGVLTKVKRRLWD